MRLSLIIPILLLVTLGIFATRPAAVQGATKTSVKTGNWSDPTVWSGGSLPGSGDSVVIANGHTVTFDMTSAQVAGVDVNAGGTFKFSTTKTTKLTSSANIVVRGTMEVGTESLPIPAANTATVQFLLNEANMVGGPTEVPVATDVGLWVVDSGILRTGGARNLAWTKVLATINVGSDTVIIGENPEGWAVGDEVVVTPSEKPNVTDFYNHFDERTISSITDLGNGTWQIKLSAGVTHPHPVTLVGGDTLAPEILNLTRNVIFQGQDTNNRSHVIAINSGKMYVSDTRFKWIGPDKFSRYAVHWHDVQDASRGNWVKRSVIDKGGSRAVVTHFSNGIDVVENIAYDLIRRGGGVFWVETNDDTSAGGTPHSTDNVFNRNVAAKIDFPPGSQGVDEQVVWGFEWPGVKKVTFLGNVAVGIAGGRQGQGSAGFRWTDRLGCGKPPDADFCSVPGQSDEIFIKNESHDNGVAGITLWRNDNNPHPPTPVIDEYNDTLLWFNGENGIAHGAYVTDWKWFQFRSYGNLNANINHVVIGAFYQDTILDGLGISKYGFESFISDSVPSVLNDLVTPNWTDFRRTTIAGYTDAAVSHAHEPCTNTNDDDGDGLTEEFDLDSRRCNPTFPWFIDSTFGTGKHFDFDGAQNIHARWRIQNYVGTPTNFELRRKDYCTNTIISVTCPAGAAYDPISDSLKYAITTPVPVVPTVILTTPINGVGISDNVTLTATATNAGRVEFFANGAIIGTDNTAPYSLTWNSTTSPYTYNFLYARACVDSTCSTGEVSYSRVAMVKKGAGSITPTPPPPPAAIPGDFNADGQVNQADLDVLIPTFPPASFNATFDLNADGKIDASDAGILFSNWTS